MADPLIQATMFFEGVAGGRQHGWSESHYDAKNKTLPDALASLIDLANARKKLLGGGVLLQYLRVSDANVFRDSQVAEIDSPVPIAGLVVVPPPQPIVTISAPGVIYNNQLTTEAGRHGNVNDVFCDQPWSAVVVRLEGGAPYTQRRTMTIRGNPDYVLDTQTQRPVAARWNAALAEYIGQLLPRNGVPQYGFKALLAIGINATLPIANITVNAANGSPTFAMGAQAGGVMYTNGAQVRISKAIYSLPNGMLVRNGQFGLNGTYTITNVQAIVGGGFTFQVVNEPVLPLGAVIVSTGTAQMLGYSVVPYLKEVDRRFGSRDTGSPFDRPHGRRKRRKQRAS